MDKETHKMAVIHALQQLDIDRVNELLLDQYTYQDIPKADFITHLAALFNSFKNSGDTFLNIQEGFCRKGICNGGSKGYSFIGNHSNNFIDLLVVVDEVSEPGNSIVTDLFECTKFNTLQTGIVKSTRLDLIVYEEPEYDETDEDDYDGLDPEIYDLDK